MAVLVLVLLGPAAAASDEDPADNASTAANADALAAEADLAERFAPVMMLVTQEERCGPGEPYAPSDVEVLLDNDSVALRGPWTDQDLVEVGPDAETLSRGLRDYALDLPPDPLDPGCDYETWAERQWGEDAEPTIYAHVARQKGVTDRIALQFAFYYPFNDYNNKHESDWERIQLEFATDDPAEALRMTPDRVVYAQHYGSEAAEWGGRKLEVVDETHPVVYVSAGSHASQFSEGLFLGNNESTGFGCDTTAGPHDEVRPLVRTIPSVPAQAAELFPWIAYEGHWGEVGPRRFYTGPTGPNMKQFWKKPFTWSAGARERSYPVPGAQSTGSRATGFFCSAVGRGSDLFRGYVSDPGPLLALVLAGLLGVGWWLRRADWRTPLVPVVARRSASEVLVASLAWVRRRPRVFALLALGCVGPLLVSALLQGTQSSVPSPVRLAVGALAVASLTLTTATVAHALLVQGPEVSVRTAYAAAGRRLPRTALSLAIAALALVLLGGTLVGLPVAVVVLVGWILLVPVSQVEDHGVLGSLRRSWRLARHSRRVLVPVLMVAVLLGLVLGLVLSALTFVVFTAPFAVVDAVPALVTATVWPLLSVVLAYAYASAVAVSDDRPEARAEVAG